MNDYATWYARISSPFRTPRAARTIALLDKGLVAVIATAFLATLAALAVTGDGRVIRAALVPALTFTLVTAIRAALNAPRPYDLYDIDPLIHKDTHGKSLPSRHLASATIIAFALSWLCAGFGTAPCLACSIATGASCIAVAFARVVGGVHFPRDVVAAIALSAACGLVGFVIIP